VRVGRRFLVSRGVSPRLHGHDVGQIVNIDRKVHLEITHLTPQNTREQNVDGIEQGEGEVMDMEGSATMAETELIVGDRRLGNRRTACDATGFLTVVVTSKAEARVQLQ